MTYITPDLSRRAASALQRSGIFLYPYTKRLAFLDALEQAGTWENLSLDWRRFLVELERSPMPHGIAVHSPS